MSQLPQYYIEIWRNPETGELWIVVALGGMRTKLLNDGSPYHSEEFTIEQAQHHSKSLNLPVRDGIIVYKPDPQPFQWKP